MPGYHILFEDFLRYLSKHHEIVLIIPECDISKVDRSFKIDFFSTKGHKDYPIPFDLVSKLKKGSYDVFMIGEDFQITSILTAIYCNINNIPFILIQEKYFISRKIFLSVFHRALLLLICPFIWKSSDSIIAHSRAAKDFLIEHGAKEDKISCIPLGVDTKKFKPDQKRNDDELRIVSVARLTDHKGLPFLIQAMKILKDKNYPISLTIIGDGPLRDYLKNMVDSLFINDAIEFIEYIPYEQMPNVYNKYNIFILVSVVEVFGMAVLEAKASGLPSILTKIGGLADLIEEGEDGLYVLERDSESIVLAVEALMCPNVIQEFARKARENAIKKYDWEKIATDYSSQISKVRKKQ